MSHSIFSASQLAPILQGRTTAFCGFGKGSGKSTALSWALRKVQELDSAAIMTIGAHNAARAEVKGEDSGALKVRPGDLALTSLPRAQASGAAMEIVHTVPGRTTQGRLVVARAHRSGEVSLVGPEHLSSLQEAIAVIRGEGWSSTILIDGAADRLTQLGALPDLQFLYTMCLGPHNLTAALEQLRFLQSLLSLPLVESASTAAEAKSANTTTEDKSASTVAEAKSAETAAGTKSVPFHFPGALTAGELEKLPEQPETLIIEDFSKVFLTFRQWQQLLKSTQVYVKRRIPLAGVWIVSRELEKARLDTALAEIELPFIYNPYLQI